MTRISCHCCGTVLPPEVAAGPKHRATCPAMDRRTDDRRTR